MLDLTDLVEALAPSGLTVRGALNLDDAGRALASAFSVVLVGNAGGAFWPIFERWYLSHAGIADPLDSWSHEVIGDIARRFGARAVSPSDRPFLPFQQWAMQAEGLRPSPLGVLMHPEFGLWHAYRGALLFDVELKLHPLREVIHLCDLCDGKPCKRACPVDAHAREEFAYRDCLAHLRGNPHRACLAVGCLDRNACPYGVQYRYPPAMQAFISAAFVTTA